MDTLAPSFNGDTHEAPALDQFTFHGQPLEMDVVDTYFEFEDIAKANMGTELGHRGTLNEIIRRVQERYAVTLSYGHADWLFDKIGELVALKKKQRADAMHAMLTSPSSTG